MNDGTLSSDGDERIFQRVGPVPGIVMGGAIRARESCPQGLQDLPPERDNVSRMRQMRGDVENSPQISAPYGCIHGIRWRFADSPRTYLLDIYLGAAWSRRGGGCGGDPVLHTVTHPLGYAYIL